MNAVNAIYLTSTGPYQKKLSETFEYDGVYVEGGVKCSKEVFISIVVKGLEVRFEEFKEAESVVRSTRIADLKPWPISWEELKGSPS